MSSFAFSRATETELGSESVCSFPATMHQTFYGRLHRRASAVNKIKVKDSKRVFRCLEQELWPNRKVPWRARKVTNYQLCYGAPRPPNGAWMAPARLPRPVAEVPFKGRAVAPDDSKSDVSPPVSELGSLPLTDVAVSPSAVCSTSASSRARPRSATPQTRGSSALKSLGARCSEGRPQSALASRCRSSGRSATATATSEATAATFGATSVPSAAPSAGVSGKENPAPSTPGLERLVDVVEEGRCPVRNRSRVKH
ncbi:unnamed protein product, partial [Cladocopium goreaui]